MKKLEFAGITAQFTTTVGFGQSMVQITSAYRSQSRRVVAATQETLPMSDHRHCISGLQWRTYKRFGPLYYAIADIASALTKGVVPFAWLCLRCNKPDLIALYIVSDKLSSPRRYHYRAFKRGGDFK